ncbi:hypothetical protein [Streptomyces sulphureus]|uniref:hypothetical protein n=1 Tax=Streptomyces sulphureus TaxID=47758 RepID=UPI000367D404
MRVNGGHPRTPSIPATYLLDRNGTVRWSFVDTDCTRRAEPAELLVRLDELKAEERRMPQGSGEGGKTPR